MMKKEYVEPALEIISLASIQETMTSGSAKGKGANVSFYDSSDFDTYFGS